MRKAFSMTRFKCALMIFYFVGAIPLFSQTNKISNLYGNLSHSVNRTDSLHSLFLLVDEQQSISSDTLLSIINLIKSIGIRDSNDFYHLQKAIADYYIKIGDVKKALQLSVFQ
ncbi:MAG: hypothetical protein RIQ89_649, partial [Bacteroidota bacterium]